jgi:hypothetical protein
MAIFTVEITDADKLAGITAALTRHNDDKLKTLALAEGDEGYQAAYDALGLIVTDADYVQFVMDKAAESYAKAKADAE